MNTCFVVSLILVVLKINEVKLDAVSQQNNENFTIVNNRNFQRIVGGVPSYLGELPWQGLFLIRITSTLYQPSCGCSLLDNQWVVTAAHCTAGRAASSILLAFNLYDTSNTINSQQYRISNIYDHSLYDPSTLKNDISLLKVDGFVTTSSNVRPIALPTQGVSETVGKNCIISGWGTTQFGGASSMILRKATVPIIGSNVCNSWYNPRGTIIHSNQLCAGYEEGGVDSCQGDSGGPLACPSDTSEVYILQGITSFGIGCASFRTPGVYTRVSDYTDWINNVRDCGASVDIHPLRIAIVATMISLHFLQEF